MAKQLTEAIIKNANSYVPLKQKTAMAKRFAEDCIEKVEIKYKDEMLPPMYKEDVQKRMLWGMCVLLTSYLMVFDKDSGEDFRGSDYDSWGGTAVLNQLNRFKSSKDAEVRDKAYDILDDYREFYGMLGKEINSLLNTKNDLIYRALAYLDGKMTPQYFEKSLEDFRSVQEEAMEYINNRDKLFSEKAVEGE
jgi:hypothetical protein